MLFPRCYANRASKHTLLSLDLLDSCFLFLAMKPRTPRQSQTNLLPAEVQLDDTEFGEVSFFRTEHISHVNFHFYSSKTTPCFCSELLISCESSPARTLARACLCAPSCGARVHARARRSVAQRHRLPAYLCAVLTPATI